MTHTLIGEIVTFSGHSVVFQVAFEAGSQVYFIEMNGVQGICTVAS